MKWVTQLENDELVNALKSSAVEDLVLATRYSVLSKNIIQLFKIIDKSLCPVPNQVLYLTPHC